MSAIAKLAGAIFSEGKDAKFWSLAGQRALSTTSINGRVQRIAKLMSVMPEGGLVVMFAYCKRFSIEFGSLHFRPIPSGDN